MKISNILRRFDAYPKTLEDFSIRTLAGAVGKDILLIVNPAFVIKLWFFSHCDFNAFHCLSYYIGVLQLHGTRTPRTALCGHIQRQSP